MNINLQPKLLRVLQEGTVRRVGGMTEHPVDVRVLSNMNITPQQALEEHKLRRDLFYRLGVVDLRVPNACGSAWRTYLFWLSILLCSTTRS